MVGGWVWDLANVRGGPSIFFGGPSVCVGGLSPRTLCAVGCFYIFFWLRHLAQLVHQASAPALVNGETPAPRGLPWPRGAAAQGLLLPPPPPSNTNTRYTKGLSHTHRSNPYPRT
jgi:hypothetical protein